MAFNSAVDIANRALQHCGVPRLDATQGFLEQSQRAAETKACYGDLKRAELRGNVWRFATRRTALRPIDTNTMVMAPALWSGSTTYFTGSIVSDSTGFLWISRIRNNLNNQPDLPTPAAWEPYFGPLTVGLYDSSKAYFSGELVYTASGDGTYNTYLSLISGNALDPSLPNEWSIGSTYFQNQVVQRYPAWASGTTYGQGQTVTYTDGFTYTSLTNGNIGHIPPASGTNWGLVPTLTIASQQVPVTNVVSLLTSSPVIEWASATVYSIGAIVMFKGTQYVSIANANTANYPNAAGSTAWAAMTGGTLYMSLIDLNIGNDPLNAPALFAIGTTYAMNALVGASDGQIYKSLANGNVGHDPTLDGGVHWQPTGTLNPWTSVFTQGGGNQQWLQIGGASFPFGVALVRPNTSYWPIGSGPVEQSSTRNVYQLPAGYLRIAPQDPSAGGVSYLGFPSNLMANDWVFNGNYLVTRASDPIVFRFVADVADVSQFDDMFCEMLGARVAEAIVPIVAPTSSKLADIRNTYRFYMAEAKRTNGIEIGPTEDELDDYIACRA
jgi:hypothetical protein